MPDPILLMRGITKEFPGVTALRNVDLRVERGEIHALMGENGAGKSTLMRILSGVHPYGTYGGEIHIDGRPRAFRNINDSEAAGIAIIHQELALVPQLSIAENIFLGNERTRSGVIDWKWTLGLSQELLERVGLRADPRTPVSALGVGEQQLVEIAKALSKDVRLLILDEPTSALNEADSANLLRLLGELEQQGITSILISHKLDEVTEVSDTITIIRDGETIETLSVADTGISEERIIRGMVGRALDQRYPPRSPDIGETLLEVRDWTVAHPTQPDRLVVDRAGFRVRRGEIVGFAGLMGAGRTELAMSLFGRCYGHHLAGTVHKDGVEIRIPDVATAIEHRIAYVPEDRKELGLILDDDIRHNLTLAGLDRVSRRRVIDHGDEMTHAERLREALGVKAPDVSRPAGNLSGGNQQKVVLGKWMFTDPELLILDEPTRGIDVGAKYEIYRLIHHLAAQGKGVVLISSELPELLGMCDRIYVMSEGRVTGEVHRDAATQESILRSMTATTA